VAATAQVIAEQLGANSTVNEHQEVREAIDLRNVVTEGCVHLVDLPASEEDLRRLRTAVFAIARPRDRLLIASTSNSDFSWELMNRLIFTEPTLSGASDIVKMVGEGARVSNGEFALLLMPSLLGDASRSEDARRYTHNAVVLARKNITAIADVDALAQLFQASGFTIRAVVIVDCEQRRWRKWRRFARAYGVWSDPERPWPAIDVLDDEMIRTARRHERPHRS
jgi:hypothetical protein